MNTPLRKIRLKNEMTLEELSKVAGLGISGLSRLERGQRGASKATLDRLVTHFGGAIQEAHILYPERYPNFLTEIEKVA